MSKANSFEWMRRDKWHIPKFDEFQAVMEKSKKECGDLHKLNELILTLGFTLLAFPKIPSFFNENRFISEKYSQSFVFTSFMELLRGSARIVFLTGCGLYKNAYHDIRYALESIVQSYYLDSRHPNADFPTKIAILKEVEDLPQYRGVRLIKKFRLPKKDMKILNEEYGRLSRKIHFTHGQLVVTATDVMESSYCSAEVDCSEVSNVYYSMRMLYGIFFFLFLTYFPEVRTTLLENNEFVKIVKDHNLNLLSKVLSI